MDKVKGIKTIVLDICETLVKDVSWTYLTKSLGGDSKHHIEIFDKYRSGQISYPVAKGQLIDLWKKTGNCTRDYMIQIFKKVSYRKDAAEVIEKLQKKYEIVLISGAMDLYVETIAQKLNVKKSYANTKLIFDDNGHLIDFDYELDQSKKKLEQFTTYSQQSRISPEECAIVGDGDNDIALFDTLGFGVVFDTGKNLEIHKHGDTVISELRELTDIFL